MTKEKRLSDDVADSILSMITVEKRFKAGDKLPNENELSEELGVSRTTLREAIRILAAGNVVEIQRGRGTFVKENFEENTLDELSVLTSAKMNADDLYEMRLIFEPEAAYYATLRATESELQRIISIGENIEQLILEDKDRTLEEQAFHRSIAKATHNDFMNKLMPVIQEAIDKGVTLSKKKKAASEDTVTDHRILMNFMKSRNAEGARNAMRIHILHAIERLGLEKQNKVVSLSSNLTGEKMNIEKQFNLIAEEYDSNRRKFIPCFDDFYKNTTEFIVSNIKKPKQIVDLGAGTGLLTYFWYQQCPDSKYVLVDIADEMLNVARKRFEGIENISYQTENYIHKLPDILFDMVISALSIHHLEDKDKRKLFARIYDSLPDGGLFVNYDQFCAGQPEMDHWFHSFWESQLANSGLTDKDIELWKERRKLDRECTVRQEVDMLKDCRFKMVKCVYSYQKFSVIVAIK